MEEILDKRGKIFIIVSVFVCLIFRTPECYLLLLFYLILLIGIFLLTAKDKIKNRIQKIEESNETELAEKRTCQLECRITKVQQELDTIEYLESVVIYCEYVTQDGKNIKFKSKKVLGVSDCKEGDVISVLVDPQNYSNYYVQLQGLVHD